MIQRIQSLWLLLAGAAGLLIYKMPLWKGIMQDGTLKVFLGSEKLLLFIIIIATSALAFTTIFLFKNRKLQKSLCLLGLLLSIIIVILEFVHVEDLKVNTDFKENMWQIGAVLPVLMIILFILAYSGVRKDEKLVKSLERLR